MNNESPYYEENNKTALKDMTKPMAVSEYKLLQEVPCELKSSLTTI
ncbi:MAG: hypothetical protein HPY74_11590 [Firmicutes bacterium]|nr:hypothetical protein [Bacillota bacterium]